MMKKPPISIESRKEDNKPKRGSLDYIGRGRGLYARYLMNGEVKDNGPFKSVGELKAFMGILKKQHPDFRDITEVKICHIGLLS